MGTNETEDEKKKKQKFAVNSHIETKRFIKRRFSPAFDRIRPFFKWPPYNSSFCHIFVFLVSFVSG